jgi:alkylated DNA repair dioxygenase AlkB
MFQDMLPDAGPLTLLDDAEGGVRYWPALVDATRAAHWFRALREEVDWRSERRPMYDRVVDVPRLLAGFRLDGEPLPPSLAAAAALVRDALGVPFTHVGLNRYRDGNDSVAPHNDKLYSIVAPHPIALLSLGAPRRMDIRAKELPRRTIRVELAPGSLLVMSHASQHHWDHGIPKTKVPVGERISLAFRVRPEDGRRRW